jgi:hypothetical protein
MGVFFETKKFGAMPVAGRRKDMEKSAGVLLYHQIDGEPQVLLVHSNGLEDLEPRSIPKGEFDARHE